MTVKCLLVDDEPLAIRVLENHISKIPWLEVAARCQNPVEAFAIVKNHKIDLIFLDIQMPELSGLDFLRSLSHPPAVIFTTAYRQFAADAYDLDGLDYLVKPVSFPRFARAVNKYLEQFGSRVGLPAESSGYAGSMRKSFFIRQGREMVRIYIDEIIYIESLKDYIQIFLKDQKYYYKASISDIEEELRDDQFLRIHKSFLVSISKIRSVTPTEIITENSTLPIGRSYKAIVMKKLGIG